MTTTLLRYFKEVLDNQASRIIKELEKRNDYTLSTYTSHRLDHALEVVKRSSRVLGTVTHNQRLHYLCEIAAMCHDLGMANGMSKDRSWSGYAEKGSDIRSNHAMISGLEILSRGDMLCGEYGISKHELYLVALAAMSHSKSNSTLSHFQFRNQPGFCNKDGDFGTFITKAEMMGEKFSNGIGAEENVFDADYARSLLQHSHAVRDLVKLSYALSLADAMSHSADSCDIGHVHSGKKLNVELQKSVTINSYQIISSKRDGGTNIIVSTNTSFESIKTTISGKIVDNEESITIYTGERTSTFEPVTASESYSEFNITCYAADKYPDASILYIMERVGEVLRFPYGRDRILFNIRIPYDRTDEGEARAQVMVYKFFCEKDPKSGLGRIKTFNDMCDQFKYNGGSVLTRDRIYYRFCDLDGNELPRFKFQ